jgi:hypothetical protein
MDYDIGISVLRKHADEYLAAGGVLKHPPTVSRVDRRRRTQLVKAAVARSGAAPAGGLGSLRQEKQDASLLRSTTSFRHSVMRLKRSDIKKDVLNLLGGGEFPIQQEVGGSFQLFDADDVSEPAGTAAANDEAARKAALRVRQTLAERRRKEQQENTVLDALLDARKEKLLEIDRLQRQRRIVERRRASSALGVSTNSGHDSKPYRLPPAMLVPATLNSSVPLLTIL